MVKAIRVLVRKSPLFLLYGTRVSFPLIEPLSPHYSIPLREAAENDSRMACRAPGLVLGINLERLNTPLVDFVPVLRIPNRPRPRLFPGGTSKTPAACFLAFPFLPSSRSALVFDHESTTRTTTTTRTIREPRNPPGRCSPCKGA
jgi:hypothetical protein